MSKLIVIGPTGSGKTALVRTLTGNAFEETHTSTRGVQVHSISHKNWRGYFVFYLWNWDDEQSTWLGDSYTIGSKFAIVMIDVTANNSFVEIAKIIHMTQKVEPDIYIAVFVNKIDLLSEEDREDRPIHNHYVPIGEKIRVYEVSIKNDMNTRCALDWFSSIAKPGDDPEEM